MVQIQIARIKNLKKLHFEPDSGHRHSARTLSIEIVCSVFKTLLAGVRSIKKIFRRNVLYREDKRYSISFRAKFLSWGGL